MCGGNTGLDRQLLLGPSLEYGSATKTLISALVFNLSGSRQVSIRSVPVSGPVPCRFCGLCVYAGGGPGFYFVTDPLDSAV